MLRWILLIAGLAFQAPEKSIVTGRVFLADGTPAVGVPVAALDATTKAVVTSVRDDKTSIGRLRHLLWLIESCEIRRPVNESWRTAARQVA